MRKRGFTIVEMLMVIAILGVLVGIVTAASSSAIRQARFKRTQAMMAVLQAGLNTYYAQERKWPGVLDRWCENGPQSAYGKKARVDYLTDTEADTVFQTLVRKSATESPMLDITGLFVARASAVGTGKSNSKVRGMDLRDARAKKGKRDRISFQEMAFGYPEKETGNFRRFIIRYNFDTDSVGVMTQNEGDGSANDYKQETHKTWPETPEA